MAIKFLERVVKHYRKEQWDRILRPILQLWYICARETKDIRTMVALLIEMACYSWPLFFFLNYTSVISLRLRFQIRQLTPKILVLTSNWR